MCNAPLMKIFILRPRPEILDVPDNPWVEREERTHGHVVVAATAKDARRLASEEAWLEGKDAWLSADLSTCELIDTDNEGVVLTDAWPG